MEKLSSSISNSCLKGEHVLRHRKSIWNGMWVDMMIKHEVWKRTGWNTRYNPETQKCEEMGESLHVCNSVLHDLYVMLGKCDVTR